METVSTGPPNQLYQDLSTTKKIKSIRTFSILIFPLLCSLFLRQPFRVLFCFFPAGVKCRAAAEKRLPVLHRSAVNILISLGIIEPILVTLKIKYSF